MFVDSMEGDGFNSGIFDTAIPTAVPVLRSETDAKQIEDLLKGGKAFSASGQWNYCNSRIGNTGVTIRAQKRQLELNEAVRANTENKKNEAQLKALESAETALAKYEFNAESLSEMDWGDIIRWVVPEAKVAFLLKDLKKKDQILAKLATLPKDWSTYIPCRDALPAAMPEAPVS
jgi:hypothetical protein